ncbi:MAG TPA: sugar phosphate nucleotidyltransferase, partial [Nitrospira sp.]|nr:sugar phosphate nucleotidyltransferase [Nitrospira sp.]
MKAMILAAGLGTRLRPLTNAIPKPLLPIAGTPLIVWNLLLLKRHGFQDVIINLHHLGPMIEQALGNGSKYGMRIYYSHEPVILGTGGGIKQA